MVRIHGIVYILIGAAVAVYSYIVDPVKLSLFMYAGIAFVAFGFIRLIAISSKKQRAHAAHQRIQQPVAKRFCSGCGSALNDFQNFCHNCGQRMFHKK